MTEFVKTIKDVNVQGLTSEKTYEKVAVVSHKSFISRYGVLVINDKEEFTAYDSKYFE